MTSLRQSFLNGSLTRLPDADSVLRGKIVEFVANGEFGLASGLRPDGTYERTWFKEIVQPDEVLFDANLFLLDKKRVPSTEPKPEPKQEPKPEPEPEPQPKPKPQPEPSVVRLRIQGNVPPEVWNRIGRTLIPKLHKTKQLTLGLNFSLELAADEAKHVEADLKQALADLGLSDSVTIKRE